MRSWSIEIWLLDARGTPIPANIFEKVVYNLHPSFERPKQRMANSSVDYTRLELTGYRV